MQINHTKIFNKDNFQKQDKNRTNMNHSNNTSFKGYGQNFLDPSIMKKGEAAYQKLISVLGGEKFSEVSLRDNIHGAYKNNYHHIFDINSVPSSSFLGANKPLILLQDVYMDSAIKTNVYIDYEKINANRKNGLLEEFLAQVDKIKNHLNLSNEKTFISKYIESLGANLWMMKGSTSNLKNAINKTNSIFNTNINLHVYDTKNIPDSIPKELKDIALKNRFCSFSKVNPKTNQVENWLFVDDTTDKSKYIQLASTEMTKVLTMNSKAFYLPQSLYNSAEITRYSASNYLKNSLEELYKKSNGKIFHMPMEKRFEAYEAIIQEELKLRPHLKKEHLIQLFDEISASRAIDSYQFNINRPKNEDLKNKFQNHLPNYYSDFNFFIKCLKTKLNIPNLNI